MKKVIAISLSPNAESDDVLRACALLFQPWRWVRGNAREKCEDEFRSWLGVPHVFGVESGRGALTVLLKALGIGEGDEVLLQAYTCVAVPDPVLWAGARPVYVDIDHRSLNMSPDDLRRKITPKSKALIIQHTFGNPADIEGIIAIAREHHLAVIEDCAHALGSEYHGKKVGTFGDAAFFSFGRDKVISSIFGGMLIVQQPELAKRVQGIYRALPDATRAWVMQQLLHPLWFMMVKSIYGVNGAGKALAVFGRKAGVFAPSVYAQEKHGGRPPFVGKRLPNALAVLARAQFLKLDRYNAHREKIAQLYSALFCGDPIPTSDEVLSPLILPHVEEKNRHIFLRYTIQTDRAEEIMQNAKRRGIYLGDWYQTPIAPTGVDESAVKYLRGSCPVAERVAKRSVNLPTHIGISVEDAEKVFSVVKSSIRSVAGGAREGIHPDDLHSA